MNTKLEDVGKLLFILSLSRLFENFIKINEISDQLQTSPSLIHFMFYVNCFFLHNANLNRITFGVAFKGIAIPDVETNFQHFPTPNRTEMRTGKSSRKKKLLQVYHFPFAVPSFIYHYKTKNTK